MANLRTVWVDESKQRVRTYSVKQNSDGTITLTPSPGEIYTFGTPVNAANLNLIEEVLQTVGVALDYHATTTQAELRALESRIEALEKA